MNKFLRILFLLLLVAPVMHGQDNNLDVDACIKMAPLSLLDTYSGSSLRMGVEWKIHKNIAGYTEIGGYTPWLSGWNGLRNNTGVTLKLETKVFLNKEERCGGYYLSAEVYNKYQTYSTTDSIAPIPAHPYKRDYSVFKNITCVTFKFGQTYCRKQILFDMFVGLGGRYHNVVNTLSTFDNNHIQSSDDYGTNRVLSIARQEWTVNFDAGVKIGYILE